MVGGKQADHGVGIEVEQNERSQTDGGRRVAPHRLGQNLPGAEARKLARDLAPQVLVGDDPETRGRSQRQQARHRLLDHGLLAIERQQLLGATLPAQRPEAGAAAAGKNHGMEVGFGHE